MYLKLLQINETKETDTKNTPNIYEYLMAKNNIKQIFVVLLSFSRSLATKGIYLANQLCMN